MKKDIEFYDRGDEFRQLHKNDELCRESHEFFGDQKNVSIQVNKKYNKNLVKVSKIVVAVCTVVTIVGISDIKTSNTVAITNIAPISISENISPQQQETEATISVIDNNYETEIEIDTLTLTSTQKEYISNVWNAFSNDNIDLLGELAQQDIFLSFVQDEFMGKVFLPNEHSAFVKDSFNGQGVLFDYESDSEANVFMLYLVNLQNGIAGGSGKELTYVDLFAEDQSGNTHRYYVGEWEQNAANGEGKIICRHDDGEQNDIGQGIFSGGMLVDGIGEFLWSDGRKREIIINDGNIVSTSNYDPITGETKVHKSEELVEQDHFGFIDILN